MKFAQPLWLVLGFTACVALLWRYRRFDARQHADLARFASGSLITQLTASVSSARRKLKRALVVSGVALIAVALARPLLGFRWEEIRRKGLDLLVAVDTSKSMLAQDVKPDRLTRARMAVEDLLAKLDGDRVGLIAFAGNAFLQCPLTLDFDAFRQSLQALDVNLIPRGGTDIAAAIHEAESALEGTANNERILVLITDGEDLEGNALDAARAAAAKGLKIFAVGVGSASGELIPVPDEKGGTQFAKDASGQFVKSRLDEAALKKIAEATGGLYQPLGPQAQGLEMIYREGLAKFARHDVASRQQKVYLERFQWPLALGLFCLVLEPLIGIRRRIATKPGTASASALAIVTGSFPRKRMKSARPASSLAAAAALAFLMVPLFASASTRTAEEVYAQGNFARAEQEYRKIAEKNPQKPALRYNHGAAAYKNGQFDAAAESFQGLKTDDPLLQEDNHYNLGNAQYRLGQKTEKSNPQETIKTWEDALKSYEAALQLKADDADAQFNRDFVKRKLEELKKQQEQQKKNQEDQKNQKDQNDKTDQQNQHGSSGDQEKKDQNRAQDQQNKQDQPKSDRPEQNKLDPKESQHTNGRQSEDQKEGSNKNQRPDAGKDQKAQAGQKPNKPESTKDRANQKPELANKNGKPAEKKDRGDEEADAQGVPGKMSKREAKQLLDSLKEGDRKMPLTPAPRGNATGRDDEPIKDW